MFGMPVAFGTLRIGSVFSTLGIISSEFWYICGTFVHFTFTSYSSIQSWNINISGLENKRPPSWNYISGFDFDHITILRMSNFGRVMMLYRFSRWRTLRRNFTSDFGLVDVLLFRRSMPVSKPNFVVIAQSIAEIQLFPVWKIERPP